MTTETVLFLTQQTLVLAVPLLLAGLGELIVERSGSVNIGIEGMMLAGALAGWAAAVACGSAWAGAAAATAVGVMLSALFALVVIAFRADQIVAGTAVNLLAVGLTGLVGARLQEAGFDRRPPVFFERVGLPLLDRLPGVGPGLFGEGGVFHQHGLLYVTVLGLVGCHLYLYHTRWGIELRALGENPAAAEAAGAQVNIRRTWAVLFGGACAGLAGAYLSIMYTHRFHDNMTAGRGFLALALVIFGRWRPLGLLTAGLVFGAFYAAANQMHVAGWSVTLARHWVDVAPYLLSLLLLALLARRASAPAALGQPYERPHD